MVVHGTASYLQVADSKSAIPNDKVFAAWFPRMPKDNTEIQVKTAEGKIFTIDPARIVVALSCADANPGGPVVNGNGEVVGMLTSKVKQPDGKSSGGEWVVASAEKIEDLMRQGKVPTDNSANPSSIPQGKQVLEKGTVRIIIYGRGPSHAL